MSGKGGVGKSTIAVNLAYTLAKGGHEVGLLDMDIHGPNVPKMLGIDDEKLMSNDKVIRPVKTINHLYVVSMAFLLYKQDAVIWRGPMKHNLIKQFVDDVDWGVLDYLVVDFPPGTGDEAISISQLLNDITGCIIVSTPQQVALADVTRAIDFAKKIKIPVIGVVENISGDIFGRGSVRAFAKKQDVKYLGNIELDKRIAESGDAGLPFMAGHDDNTARFGIIADKVKEFCKR